MGQKTNQRKTHKMSQVGWDWCNCTGKIRISFWSYFTCWRFLFFPEDWTEPPFPQLCCHIWEKIILPYQAFTCPHLSLLFFPPLTLFVCHISSSCSPTNVHWNSLYCSLLCPSLPVRVIDWLSLRVWKKLIYCTFSSWMGSITQVLPSSSSFCEVLVLSLILSLALMSCLFSECDAEEAASLQQTTKLIVECALSAASRIFSIRFLLAWCAKMSVFQLSSLPDGNWKVLLGVCLSKSFNWLSSRCCSVVSHCL